MAGKPTIPPEVHKRIRDLRARGMSFAAIEETVGCSRYTVRKALYPDYGEIERARHRAHWPKRAPVRKANLEYQEYRKAFFATDAWRAKARETMKAVRDRRKGTEAE